MPDWPHIKDIGGHKTQQTFAEADFLAFLTYAGPPPLEKEGELYRTTMLRERIKYVGLADIFCESYFGMPESCQDYADYIGFYGKFIEWHACKMAISHTDPTLFVASDTCVYQYRKELDNYNRHTVLDSKRQVCQDARRIHRERKT